MSSVYCIQMHMLCTSDIYCCYLHMYMSSAYYLGICILYTLPTIILDMFLPNRQYQCHPYIISSTLYISYYVQLSFCTLSAQMHIVHVVYMLSTHVHIICLSSLTLLVFHYNLIPALETQRLKKSKKLG